MSEISKSQAIEIVKKQIVQSKIKGSEISHIYSENFGWIFLIKLSPEHITIGGSDAFLVDKNTKKVDFFPRRHAKEIILHYQNENGYKPKISNEEYYFKKQLYQRTFFMRLLESIRSVFGRSSR